MIHILSRFTRTDLYAGIIKLIDTIHEQCDFVIEILDFDLLSTFDKMQFDSDVRSSDLLIKSMSHRLERKILVKLREYNLYGRELRYFTQTLKIIVDIEMMSDQILSTIGFLRKCHSLNDQYRHFKSLSIKRLIDNTRKLLNVFVSTYHSITNNIDVEINPQKVYDYEDKVDHIYETHSESLIQMLQADLIGLDDTFFLTSAIRSLERVADLCTDQINTSYRLLIA